MKKLNQKFYTSQEIKEMAIKEKKLPKSTNPQNIKYSFIVKARGSIFGESENKRILR